MHSALTKFEVKEARPGCLLLTCRGGLSWEDRELLATSVEEHLHGRQVFAGIVMDLGKLEFINSAGLGALFQLVQRVRGRGGKLVYANVPATLLRLFHAVGMDRAATICDDVSSALNTLSTDNSVPESPTP